jgi:glucosamine--fructose-6-phosphate aminotransferase (isomerizing)
LQTLECKTQILRKGAFIKIKIQKKMCGIVGYLGNKIAMPILINGLKKLEYRGYDSSGIALLNSTIQVYKKRGKIEQLSSVVLNENSTENIGIGHTRWATHGEPNNQNAHPHNSTNNIFSIVHNGIIENFSDIKEQLIKNGYTFKSNTDSEVLVNLIEYFYLQKPETDAELAVELALAKVEGAYGIAVLCTKEPDRIIVAKDKSPLVVGIGDGEFFIASDTSAIIEHTKQVVYLKDKNIATIQKENFSIKNMGGESSCFTINNLTTSVEELNKDGYEHFMLKEIYEQPRVIEATFKNRVVNNNSEIVLGGLAKIFPKILNARRIIIVGCGTSWHAALVGEYLIEEYAHIPVEVEYASEFRYRKPVLNETDVVILISQSGETADTLAALHLAKEKRATVVGICNVENSTLARETDAGVYTRAGVEIGVASTKAFTAQVTVLTMLALQIAGTKKTIDIQEYKSLINELVAVPEKAGQFLLKNNIKQIAERHKNTQDALYLGRGVLFPIALEGALKLKEISYIHAEGYAAGEMKHGPIALIDENMPVVVVAPRSGDYQKIVSNIQEIKARNGNVIAIITEKDNRLEELVDSSIEIPSSHSIVAPLLAVIPLQILAYQMALLRGCNVDQPRNLAKSVTVE